jgi:hypothetical protein
MAEAGECRGMPVAPFRTVNPPVGSGHGAVRLSFDSGAKTRRLTPIPKQRFNLFDDALRRLCATAQPGARRSSNYA